MTRPDQELLIRWICIALFAVIGAAVISNHSIWRDEAQAWLIVQASSSIWELVSNLEAEGHPLLWYLFLFPVTRLTTNPEWMQALHWFIAVFGIILFWRWSPFKTFQNALFTFGYFPFYEYFIISRNYALAMILAMAAAHLICQRSRNQLLNGMVLGLLAGTHVFASVLSMAFTLTFAWQLIMDTLPDEETKKSNRWFSLLLLMAVYATISVLLLSPLLFSFDYLLSETSGFSSLNLMQGLAGVLAGLTLISVNPTNHIELIPASLLMLCLCGYVAWKLRKTFTVEIFFVTALFGLLIFSAGTISGDSLRFVGFFFLIFVCTYWLTIKFGAEKERTNINWKQMSVLFTCMLVIHLANGIYMIGKSFTRDFSSGERLAEFITSQGWQNRMIISTRDAHATPVSAYLNREMYQPQTGSFGTYTKWNERREISPDEFERRIQPLMCNSFANAKNVRPNNQFPALVINSSNEPLDDITKFKLVKTFNGSINENYMLYEIQHEGWSCDS